MIINILIRFIGIKCLLVGIELLILIREKVIIILYYVFWFIINNALLFEDDYIEIKK